MANYKNIIPFIRQVEGGLSRAKTDSASKDPVPDGSGYHTNKGITWTAWKKFAPSLGITNQAISIQRFYAMSDSDWTYVFKKGYWDAIQGDQINSQSAADTLVDWAWGAGPGQAVKKLQQFLNGQPAYSSFKDEKGVSKNYLSSGWLTKNNAPDPKLATDGGMGNMTLAALNSATRINEKQFVSDFSDYKKAWYLTLPNQADNYSGWAVRLNALKDFALSNAKSAAIGIGIVIVLGVISFLIYETNANTN